MGLRASVSITLFSSWGHIFCSYLVGSRKYRSWYPVRAGKEVAWRRNGLSDDRELEVRRDSTKSSRCDRAMEDAVATGQGEFICN